ncbi:MAG TPA: hypothetical protein VHE99_12145 [Gammaproteobacteria bacterium]|nr:hypothetical protein [Gammaproteobacteria bacterium]
MKNPSLIVAVTGLLSLLHATNGLALGDPSSGTEPSAVLPASVVNSAADEDLPWFTGPLLAGSGNTIPAGHFNIEPYVFFTNAYGVYNSDRKAVDFANNFYTVSPTLIISLGLTSFMDFQAAIPYVFNHTDGETNSDAGDATFTLGFQLLRGVTDTWHPSLRGTISETVPTGDFEDLNPNRKGTDATGTGAYQTSFGLNFQQLWHVTATKYFRDRLALGYTLPSTTRIQGVNSFGGNNETSGNVKLGNQFSADLAMEYTLTNHWVPALDILYTANGGSNFTGITGTNSEGLPAIENGPSGNELSLAPAMEYNFNSHLGIIAGPWFSVAGRNATEFASAVLAVNYYE